MPKGTRHKGTFYGYRAYRRLGALWPTYPYLHRPNSPLKQFVLVSVCVFCTLFSFFRLTITCNWMTYKWDGNWKRGATTTNSPDDSKREEMSKVVSVMPARYIKILLNHSLVHTNHGPPPRSYKSRTTASFIEITDHRLVHTNHRSPPRFILKCVIGELLWYVQLL